LTSLLMLPLKSWPYSAADSTTTSLQAKFQHTYLSIF